MSVLFEASDAANGIALLNGIEIMPACLEVGISTTSNLLLLYFYLYTSKSALSFSKAKKKR